ncbi:MAG: hypothetical protein K2X93_09935 [Candidatus Obscuribacterales bacterium]|nr:hypothetical protein [Candidatus Obscuribacterales bacterium]
MNGRMRFILMVGGIAIVLTAIGTYGPMLFRKGGDDEETAQANRLAALRAKQAQVKSTPIDLPNEPQSAQYSIQDRLQSLGQPPVNSINSDSQPTNDQSRLQYLSSLPVGVIEATRKQEAVDRARLDAGRANPFDAVEGALPFPKSEGAPNSAEGLLSAGGKIPAPPGMGSGPHGLPPPPPGVDSQVIGDLPPPPPPTDGGTGITFDELPPPPEKPLLMRKLKLNAIVGDRVILTFKDRSYPAKHGMKRFITLTEGQEFDTVTLVSINRDKAVLEEDGKKQIVHLDPIK